MIREEGRREEEVKEAYYRLEAAYGTFERFIPLPEGFEEHAKIEALYTDGVLEVINSCGRQGAGASRSRRTSRSRRPSPPISRTKKVA